MRNFHISKFATLLAAIALSTFWSLAVAQENPVGFLSNNYSLAQKQMALDKLLDMETAAIPLLRQGLKQSDGSIRIECIRLLGELKDRESVPDLMQHLQNARDTRTILITSYALGQIQDKRVMPEFRGIALSLVEDVVLRRAAIITLGFLRDSAAIPALEEILEDSNELLRVFAAGSLGLLGSDKGLRTALEATKSIDRSTRMHSIQALGLIGSKKALATLNNILGQNPSMVMKQTIELAIFQINIHELPKENRATAIKNKLLTASRSTALTRWCINELVRQGGPSAKNALDEIIQSRIDERIRKQAMRKRKVLNILEKTNGGIPDEKR